MILNINIHHVHVALELQPFTYVILLIKVLIIIRKLSSILQYNSKVSVIFYQDFVTLYEYFVTLYEYFVTLYD